VPLLFLNRFYRGIGLTQLRWMFTTFHLGHYMPVTWLTYALDYLVWGMNPFGYHLTNIVLHVVTAAVFYFVALRLLRAALVAGCATDEHQIRLGAGLAAFVFAIHPLRVESVAWVTERKDVLSGLFYLLAVLAYLRALAPGRADGSPEPRWYGCSLVCFALALLSKAMTMTLPATLLILDVYPLRRFGPGPGRWLRTAVRDALKEKLPYLALSIASAVAAVIALRQGDLITSTTTLSLLQRVAISLYGLAFYLWKTAAPVRLSPLYELPKPVNPWDWPYLASGAGVVAITAGALLLRRRMPALLAAWTAYAVAVSPVLGLLHNGPQIAADRYSYLPGLGWALLAGAGLVKVHQVLGASRTWRKLHYAVCGVIIVTIVALGLQVRRQAMVWQDGEALWRHAVSLDPGSPLAHSNLGATLRARGRLVEAVQQCREAIRLRPNLPEAHMNLALAFAQSGRLVEAKQHFRRVLEIKPWAVEAHSGLAATLGEEGRWDEAFEHLRQAIRIKPASAAPHNDLGVALARSGRTVEALEEFSLAVRMDPALAEARNNLGLALAQKGQLTEAAEQFRQAALLKPDWQDPRQNLEQVLRLLGR